MSTSMTADSAGGQDHAELHAGLLAGVTDRGLRHQRNEDAISLATVPGPDGSPVRRWGFQSAFPVRWEGPVLNARSHTAATETLEIAHRGLVLAD